ncbi:MAG: ATP-binding cassette domain-containing protein [Holophagales bacterium]|jgi:putative ABC transport system ATP-binding protein|nr:ATP-binding cassette domain-containing protein [Holophagales bacterium]
MGQLTNQTFGQALVIDSLHKTYTGAEHHVFAGYSLSLPGGILCAIVGVSGVGKTTLLNCIAALDTWDSGTIALGDEPVPQNNPIQGALYRRRKVGMAFQWPHLLPEFTVLENMEMPLIIDNTLGEAESAWCKQLLELVGLQDLMHRLPSQISGGQAARVGLARALVRRPAIWLLDEPTGNLDPETANEVFQVLKALHTELRPTTLLVTHNSALADDCERVERLHTSLRSTERT